MCRLIVGRLLGQTSVRHALAQDPMPSQHHLSQTLAELKEEFIALAAQLNRNRAGLGWRSF